MIYLPPAEQLKRYIQDIFEIWKAMWKKKIDFLRVNGKQISCPICDHDKFWKRKTLLNTSILTMLGFDWANRESQNFICDECGHILWFLEK